MASTCTLDGIQALLKGAGVESDIPLFPLANIEHRPLGVYTSFLADVLVQLTECTPEAAWDAVQLPNGLGDLTVVVPRLRLSDVKPSELTDVTLQLQKTFPKSHVFEHPFQDGINLRFFFKVDTLARFLLTYIIDRGKDYGRDPSPGLNVDGSRKKAIVEYSSPNIGKDFDGNHSRSTMVGTYVSSLYEAMGWDVVRLNFLGDWGKQIGLLATGWARFNSDERFQPDPLAHLSDVFKEIDLLYQAERSDPSFAEGTGIDGEKDAFFRQLEDHDPEATALWQKFRSAFVEKYAKVYQRIGITFADDSGESSFKPETMELIETTLKEKGFYEEEDGAWLINYESLEVPGLRKVIARFRNGTTTYLLRDLAAFYERREKHSFDTMVYVAASKQASHFHQLFKALELLGHADIDSQLKHLSVAQMQLQPASPPTNGLLEDALDQCQGAVQKLLEVDREAMAEFPTDNPEVSNALAVTGLMVQDLSHKHNTPLHVNVEQIATSEGHTGIALQQWHIALRTRTSGAVVSREDLDAADLSSLDQEEYSDVLRILIQFPDVVKNAYKQPSLESSALLTYLFSVTDGLGQVWEDEDDAAGSSSSVDVAKLALLKCVHQVLENGMRILGIVPLEI
jgi:arginyl-tRNA synthetase